MDKRGQTRLHALYIFIGLALIIGLATPNIVGAFQDVSVPNSQSAVYGLVDWFTDDWELFGWIETNPISYMPQIMEDYFDSMFYSFTYLPDFMSIAIFVIMGILFIYLLVTLIPTVGS